MFASVKEAVVLRLLGYVVSLFLIMLPSFAAAFDSTSGTGTSTFTGETDGVTTTFTAGSGSSISSYMSFGETYVTTGAGIGTEEGVTIDFSYQGTSYPLSPLNRLFVQFYGEGNRLVATYYNDWGGVLAEKSYPIVPNFYSDYRLDVPSAASDFGVSKIVLKSVMVFESFTFPARLRVAIREFDTPDLSPVPLVTSVSVPKDGTYKTGETLNFVVNFSEDVTVAGGAPELALTIGDQIRYAKQVLASSSATSKLTFAYTVQEDDLDLDGISVGKLSTTGTIQNAKGKDADLSLNNLGSNKGVLVGELIADADGEMRRTSGSAYKSLPTTADSSDKAVEVFGFQLIDGGTSDNLPLNVSALNIAVQGKAIASSFKNVVWVLNGPDATSVTGSLDTSSGTLSFNGLSISVANGQSETYTVSAYYSSAADVVHGHSVNLKSIPATDATVELGGTTIGTVHPIAFTVTAEVVDVDAPTLAITANNTDLAGGQSATVTFTFNEPPVGFTAEDISVTNGSLQSLAVSNDNPLVYTATFTPATDATGSAVISVAAGSYTDEAENPGTKASLTLGVDTAAPTVEIAGPSGTTTEVFGITITFSETIKEFAAKHITVTNGTLVADSLVGKGQRFSAKVNPVLGQDVTVQVAAGAVEDMSGNKNAASNVFKMTAGTPQTALDEREVEVLQAVNTAMDQGLRNHLAANLRLNRDAAARFIQSRQLLPGRALRFVGQNYVPFAVTGSFQATQSELMTNGRFLEQVGTDDGKYRRVFFGDFDVQARDDEQVKLSVNARLAHEYTLNEDLMVGYFFGGTLDRSEVSGDFEGSLAGLEANVGGYAIKSFGDNLFADGFLTLGVGKTRMAMSDDVLELEGDYWTGTATIGGALTGVVDFEHFDLWPEFSASFARSIRPDTKITGTAYGITDSGLKLKGDEISIATVRFRPQVRVPVLAGGDEVGVSTINFAPNFSCERVVADIDTKNCGRGIELGFSSISRDGNSSIEVRFNADQYGDYVQRGMRLALEHRF